ncbi:alpha/beta fold hydrolase [uncultured Duncaniella sp.]|jgi:pimeloyl-ACP methyl ester carboxylesterase|uniref:alpha/beta fold hydrolase n=1 Tax=uncultured Duncaniella sp. TaxID=2768039 RepID=UPI0025B23176|nr:alpha/beta hydrolase [uncultured Duncaniella sp.]
MDRDTRLEGLNLHYTDSEKGEKTVVMMHGWGCNHTTLASIERVALSCGYRVINVDFPGFGDSQEPNDVWGVEEYTRQIEALTKELGIKTPIMLGHSFGGRVGILYASRNQVEKLILVDAAGIKPKRSLKYYWKVYSFKAIKRLMYLFLGKETAEKHLDARRAKAGSSDYANASPMMRRILSKVVNEDLTDKLQHIKAPTLLIWGENDTATPLSDAKKMERLIPDAGLVSFPGCGHYSFLDNPMQFAAVLRSFLGNI